MFSSKIQYSCDNNRLTIDDANCSSSSPWNYDTRSLKDGRKGYALLFARKGKDTSIAVGEIEG